MNNLFLSDEIVEDLLSKKGLKAQLKQIFDFINSFIDRSFQNENISKNSKNIPYQSELNKLKIGFSMLCIISHRQEFMKEMLKCLDINRLDLVFSEIKDPEFIKDLDMRVRYLIQELKRGDKENIQEEVIKEKKSDKEEIRDDEVYWRDLSGVRKLFSDEDVRLLEVGMCRKKKYNGDQEKGKL